MAITSRNPHAIPSGPAVAGASVAVWTIRLDAPAELIATAKSLLPPDELAKADSFRNAQAHRNYVIAHAALRQILSRHLQMNPTEISFRNGLQGKPALTGTVAGRLEFNLTHSGDLALVAVAQGAEVGIDVERVRPMPDALRLAERFFSAAESEALRTLPEDDQATAFLKLWTRKEAFVKATGLGIVNALGRFEVTMGTAATLKSIDGDTRLAAQWTLHSFQPATGYFAAVAVRSPAAQFSFEEFRATE